MNKPSGIDNKAVLESISQWEVWLIDVIQMAHDKLANTLLSQVDEKAFPFVSKMRQTQTSNDKDRLNDVDLYLKSVNKINVNKLPNNFIIPINEKKYIKLGNNEIFEVHNEYAHIISLYNPIKKEFCIVENKAPYNVLLKSVKSVEQTSFKNFYLATFHSFSSLHTTMLELEWWFNHEMLFQLNEDGNFIPKSKLFVWSSKINKAWNVIYFQSDSLDFKQTSLYIVSNEKTLEIENFSGDVYHLENDNWNNYLLIENNSKDKNTYSLFDADIVEMILEDVDSIQFKWALYLDYNNTFEQVDLNFDGSTKNYFKSVIDKNLTLIIKNRVKYTKTQNRSDKLPFLWKKIKEFEMDLFQIEENIVSFLVSQFTKTH